MARAVLLTVAVVLLTGCASIMRGPEQSLSFRSDPPDAQLILTDVRDGRQVHSGPTPATVSVKRGAGYFRPARYRALFERPGYEHAQVEIEGSPGGWYIGGNLLFGGLIGWVVVDPSTGAMWNLEPSDVAVTLNPRSGSTPSPPSAGPAGPGPVQAVARPPGTLAPPPPPVLTDGVGRPLYKVGDRWRRSDAMFTVTRVDGDGYVFTAAGGREVRLTRDLGLVRAAGPSDWVEFVQAAPPAWPLEVGRWGIVSTRWQVSRQPLRRAAFNYMDPDQVTVTWQVAGVDDVRVAGATVRAYRLNYEVHASVGAPGAKPLLWAFTLWYSPEAAHVVKAVDGGFGVLSFEPPAE